MSIYKRGDVYWFKFQWNGKLVRHSTKQGNDKVARNEEAKHRTRLIGKQNEIAQARERLGCSNVLRCDECEKLFNAEKARRDDRHAFCGEACSSVWEKKHARVPGLSEFILERFEPTMKSTTAFKTWRDFYSVGLRAIKGSSLAGVRIDKITSENITEFAAQRRAERGGLQVSTVNSSLRILRRVMRQAAEWGVIHAVPRIKLLPGERHRERVLTIEEEAKYMAAATEPLASVAAVLADTGLRPEECYRLRWETLTGSTDAMGHFL